MTVPDGKSNAAKPTFPGIAAPASRQRKPARNHQVHDDEELVAKGEDDSFAHASQAEHLAARKVGWRRLNGPDDKRVANAQLQDGLTDDAGGEGLEIEGDVGKLGHWLTRVAKLSALSFQRLSFQLPASSFDREATC